MMSGGSSGGGRGGAVGEGQIFGRPEVVLAGVVCLRLGWSVEIL